MFALIMGILLAVEPRRPFALPWYWGGFIARSIVWCSVIAIIQKLALPNAVGPISGVVLILLLATAKLTALSFLARHLYEEDEPQKSGRESPACSYKNTGGYSFLELSLLFAIFLISVALMIPAIMQIPENSGIQSAGIGSIAFSVLLVFIAIAVDVLTFLKLRYAPSEGLSNLWTTSFGLTLLTTLTVLVYYWPTWHRVHDRNVLIERIVTPVPWAQMIDTPSELHIRAISNETAHWRIQQALNGAVDNRFTPGTAETEWQTTTGVIDVREIVAVAGRSVVYIRFVEHPEKVFVIAEGQTGFHRAVVSKPGEKVKLRFMSLGDEVTSVEKFFNL